MLLSMNDKETIRDYVRTYVDGIGCFSFSVDGIEKYWAEAKKERLFDLLGEGNLILEKKVSFDKSHSDLCDELRDALYNNKFLQAFRRIINGALGYSDYSNLCQLISYSSLVNNKIEEGFTYETDKESNFIIHDAWSGIVREKVTLRACKIKINAGQKPIKALRKFIDALGLENFTDSFEEFINIVSQVLNSKRTKGILCLSVHPMDFITMSHNNHNWTSCMSWASGDGCYKAGTLEMMNCPHTLIAYLKSEDDDNSRELKYSGIAWNSKKWRTLVHIREEGFIINKNYPCFNEDLTRMVADWVRELAIENLGYDYTGEYMNTSEFFEVETFRHMYNDFGNGASEMGYLSHSVKANDHLIFTIGGKTYCLECGESLDTEEQVLCTSCYGDDEDYVDCDDCEHSTYYGDLTTVWEQGMGCMIEVCDDCLESYRYCDICEDYCHHTDYNDAQDCCCNCESKEEEE